MKFELREWCAEKSTARLVADIKNRRRPNAGDLENVLKSGDVPTEVVDYLLNLSAGTSKPLRVGRPRKSQALTEFYYMMALQFIDDERAKAARNGEKLSVTAALERVARKNIPNLGRSKLKQAVKRAKARGQNL